MSIESIGQFLPIGWDEEELGVIAETQLGKMLNSSKQTGSAKMPYLRNINLQWGRISLSDIKEMDIFDEEKEQFTLQKGDVLVCEGGEPGRSAVWNIDLPMAFQNAVHRIRPSSKINSEFLCYQFEWLVKNGFLDENFSGVTIKHFSQQKLRRIKCVIPPIQEQGKIVELLEGQFSRLDSALASIRAVRKKSERFRRSLLHAAVTGSLSGHECQAGALPAGWSLEPLSKCGKWFGGGTPSKANSKYWDDGTIPWLSPKDMIEFRIHGTQDKITNIALQESSTKLIPGPSVAIVMRSGILERTFPVAIVDFDVTLNQDMKAIIPNADVSPLWIAYVLKAFEQELLNTCRKSGTTVASIETVRLLDFKIPMPDVSEQLQIIEILEEQLSRLDASLAVADAIEKKAVSLRRSLLHAAFSGSLTKEWREGAHV
jgi:type I restriction enzyme S subunit